MAIQMMDEYFDGVLLSRPKEWFYWPRSTFEGFPKCCGPGPEGSFWERVISDWIIGLNISPACHIHDMMFSCQEKTWENFRQANTVMLRNALEINRIRGGHPLRKALRIPIITGYFLAVSSMTAAAIFFRKKA